MERPNTVAGLMAKRKELRRDLKRLIAGIRALDTAIALFRDDAPERKRYARRGSRQAFIFEYMRAAKGPVTSGQITNAWLAARPAALTADQRNEIRRKIREAFVRFEAKGFIHHVGFVGLAKLWMLRA